MTWLNMTWCYDEYNKDKKLDDIAKHDIVA